MILNVDSAIVCVDCGITYTMLEAEYARFQELAKTVKDFKMPRRCANCRKIRRNEKLVQTLAQAPPQPPSVEAVPVPSYRPEALVLTPDAIARGGSFVANFKPSTNTAAVVLDRPKPEEPIAEEVRLVLATKDFEELVRGHPIVWHGVRVILADIGFKNMRGAIELAELEVAQTFIKKNGH